LAGSGTWSTPLRSRFDAGYRSRAELPHSMTESSKSTESSQTPVSRLLLLCARARADGEAIRELVRDGVDYRALLTQAGVHGLSPLVYWRLNESCAEAVPEAVFHPLREAFRASARRVLLLTAELFRLLEAFREAGVPVVPLKGPVLAWTAYPNPALRPFGDLDLFVRREDVLPARKVLIGSGYGDSLEESQIGRGFLRWNEELPFRRDRRPVVDLHWSAGPEHFPLSSFDDAWERLSPVEIDGRAVPAFCPEDRLRFACIHGTKHAWPSLLWLSDVARLAEDASLNWDRVLAGRGSGAMGPAVQLGLLLARNLLDAPVPGGLEQTLETGRAYRIAREQLLSPSPWQNRFRELRFQSRLLDGWKARAGLWWSMIAPTPADLARVRLPARCFPLYYLVRAARLRR
jgi:hypothetical protein